MLKFSDGLGSGRLLVGLVAGAMFLAATPPAHAQTKADAQAKSPSSAQANATGNADGTGKVRQDPKNQTGISPYQATLAKGRSAAKTKDHSAASTAFADAIKQKPEEMYGYLLLAQSQMQQGRHKVALKTVETGRTKKGEAAVVGKMHHLRAELLERVQNKQGAATTLKGALADGWKKAREAWDTLRLFLEANSQLPDYKEVARARAKAVKERVAREKRYQPVIARMDNKK